MWVVLEGLPGAGKSSVMAALRGEHIGVVPEILDKGAHAALFARFVEAPARWAFTLQANALFGWRARVDATPPFRVTLMERSTLAVVHLFAAAWYWLGFMDDVEMDLLRALARVAPKSPRAAMTVVLDCPLDIIQARIAQRGRPGEVAFYTPDRLKVLQWTLERTPHEGKVIHVDATVPLGEVVARIEECIREGK